MGFSRQEYWSALPFTSPGDLPNSGIEPEFPALQADSLPAELPGKPLIVLGTVNLQGGFVPISLRPVLGTVAAYVMAYSLVSM